MKELAKTQAENVLENLATARAKLVAIEKLNMKEAQENTKKAVEERKKELIEEIATLESAYKSYIFHSIE